MMNNTNNGINIMANVIIVGVGMTLATVFEHINSPNVGTVGHCDHNQLSGLDIDTVVIDELPDGTYDAIVESVTEDNGKLFVEFKTTGKAHKGKTIFMGAVGQLPPLYIDEAYEMPAVKAEQSWQALNKGKFSKKQRRVKF